MSLRIAVRNLVERTIRRSSPRGMHVARDIARSLPSFHVDIVFDVGANVGQSARQYLAFFPDARIYCFEPVRDTFSRLQRALPGHRRVELHRLAFGASERPGAMAVQGKPDTFFLLDPSCGTPANGGVPTEAVDVVTLDGFCLANGVTHIGFLKIDTEGGDLEVLRGATSMLAEQRIDLVQVEAGMNPGNRRHVPFESLKALLESHGYFLFGIYEQVGEWPTKEPHLRRANPVFMSGRLVERNRVNR